LIGLPISAWSGHTAGPDVSNDNPFSEAQFKPLKYGPAFPERFGTLEDAHAFGRVFLSWYNSEHHHSGLGFLTPAVVHYDRAPGVREHRQRVLTAAYAVHPERFVDASTCRIATGRVDQSAREEKNPLRMSHERRLEPRATSRSTRFRARS
jgi:hypothetical protein